VLAHEHEIRARQQLARHAGCSSAELSADALVGVGRADPPDLDAGADKQPVQHVATRRVAHIEVDAGAIGADVESAALIVADGQAARQSAPYPQRAGQELPHATSVHGWSPHRWDAGAPHARAEGWTSGKGNTGRTGYFADVKAVARGQADAKEW